MAIMLLTLLLLPAAAQSDAADGSFVHVSDLHFNPFDPPSTSRDLEGAPIEAWPEILTADPDQRLSIWGEDTNFALLDTTLAEIGRAAAGADLVLVTGDLLAHDFPTRVERAFGFAPGSVENRAFAAKTTLFVLDRLRAALPGKPVLLALGNTDSGCGDYRIDPGGAYLEATRAAVRALAGPGLVAPDFDGSYRAGGYYAAAHPTLADTTILVLDDAMWAAGYRNSCGTTGLDGADAMMAWLDRQMAAARAAGRKLWLLHHIPAGFDAYATLKAGSDSADADSCQAGIVPMLAEPFGSRFVGLLARTGATVTASFAGHDHHDDYRLLRDAAGLIIGTEKIAPAISPVFGQNPGFHVFSYSRESGAIGDFRTRYLANLATATDSAAAIWQEEYAFSAGYGVGSFTPASVEAMWNDITRGGADAATFRRLYTVSHGELGAAELPAYACAIGHADLSGFAACLCGR